MITHTAAEVSAIQKQVRAGNARYLWYTNPIQVLEANLPRYGFVGRYRIPQPIKIVVSGSGRLYDIYLEQLVKRAPDGAWFIVETARHTVGIGVTPVPTATGPHPTLGVFHHTAASTQAIQAAVDADKAASMYYLNPIKVMDRNLGQYGFKTPVQVVLPLKILVNYAGRQYDVLMTQPGEKGETGIWVISSIQRHQP